MFNNLCRIYKNITEVVCFMGFAVANTMLSLCPTMYYLSVVTLGGRSKCMLKRFCMEAPEIFYECAKCLGSDCSLFSTTSTFLSRSMKAECM